MSENQIVEVVEDRTVLEDRRLTTTGDLNHIDVDNDDDVWQVQTAQSSNYGSYSIDATGNWTYNLDNSHTAVEALNTGDILIDSFTVLTEDGTSEVISITINGINENILAKITGTTIGTVTEDGTLIATGDLDHTDANSYNANDVWQIQTDVMSSYGSYSIDSSGNWTYNLDNSDTAVQGLNTGESLTDTVTSLTEDGTEQVVSITINGSADASIISTKVNDKVNEGIKFFLQGGASLTDNIYTFDGDNDYLEVEETNNSGVFNFGGDFAISTFGDL